MLYAASAPVSTVKALRRNETYSSAAPSKPVVLNMPRHQVSNCSYSKRKVRDASCYFLQGGTADPQLLVALQAKYHCVALNMAHRASSAMGSAPLAGFPDD